MKENIELNLLTYNIFQMKDSSTIFLLTTDKKTKKEKGKYFVGFVWFLWISFRHKFVICDSYGINYYQSIGNCFGLLLMNVINDTCGCYQRFFGYGTWFVFFVASSFVKPKKNVLISSLVIFKKRVSCIIASEGGNICLFIFYCDC